ncbi:TPA: hypothetical protein MHQ09_22585 [Klebsiella pneumoniae]|nr:hypothetical protein [Klebsiella pneumoniae]
MSQEHVNGQCFRIILQKMVGFIFIMLEKFYRQKDRSPYLKYSQYLRIIASLIQIFTMIYLLELAVQKAKSLR